MYTVHTQKQVKLNPMLRFKFFPIFFTVLRSLMKARKLFIDTVLTCSFVKLNTCCHNIGSSFGSLCLRCLIKWIFFKTDISIPFFIVQATLSLYQTTQVLTFLWKILWEKQKILVNQYFLLFPQCFTLYQGRVPRVPYNPDNKRP